MKNWEEAWVEDQETVLASAYEDLAREAYRLGYGAGERDGHSLGYEAGYDNGLADAEEDCCAEC